MAKKRKLEVKQKTAGSSESGSTDDKSAKGTETVLPSEVPFEGSSSKSGLPIQEDQAMGDEFKPIGRKTSDPSTDLPESGDPPNTNAISSGDVGEGDDNDPAYLDRLLEPFSKEQLISLIRDATLKHPDLKASIRQTAEVDPAHRKVFVHGLGWNTTAETLTNIFSQYGEIEDCKAVVDKLTGKSKGYGFILFKDRSGAQRSLKEPQKKIGNRMASCQLASTGPVSVQQPALSASEYTQRKIYVSNVGPDLDPKKILQFYAKYGEIEEGPLGLDKATGKFRGFCLIVYKSVEGAKKALEEPHKNFEGHILHCQKAIDGPKVNKVGTFLPQVGAQHANIYHHGPQVGRSDSAVLMGSMPSSIGGPGHLIAPPAAGIGFNQPGSGIAVSNGGLTLNPTYGNQVGGAGSLTKPGMITGYGAPQILGTYGGARTQQAFGHIGGVGSYMG